MARNRFDYSPSSRISRLMFPCSLLLFVLLLILFIKGVSIMGETSESRQLESLENALRRSISQCYAIEGAYPSDLDYLKEHYGITYDDASFFIDYEYYGDNLLPEVTVLRKRK